MRKEMNKKIIHKVYIFVVHKSATKKLTLNVCLISRWICQNHGGSPWFWHIYRNTKHRLSV